MRKPFLSILLFIIGPQLYAQNKPVTTLPFELRSDNRIYVKCKINNADTLTFLFDTGAGAMVINQSILGKKLDLILDSETNNLGLNGESKIKTSTHNKLTFGNIEVNNITYLAIPYGDAGFDGVFGNNLIKDYIIEINYHKKLLYFYNIDSYIVDKKYDKFDLKFIIGVPTISAALFVEDQKTVANFEIDTGGDSGLILSDYFSKEHHIAQLLKEVAKVGSVGSEGVKMESPIVVIPEVRLNKKQFYRVPALLSPAATGVFAKHEISGIFGNAFLKRFDVVLDIQHNKLYLKPNDYLYTPYYSFLVK